MVKGRVLVDGRGEGPLLRLTHPISLWGGVDPTSGRIVDPRHPEAGRSVAGTVLAIPGAVGSSSSSAIMLELIRNGVAPAAVVLDRSDAILALGVVVARELGRPTLPVVELPLEHLAGMVDGDWLAVAPGGRISRRGDAGIPRVTAP